MVLILLSWLYVFFTSITVGIGFSKVFRIPVNFVTSCIFGLFGVTLMASFWAVFDAVNIGFHIFLFILSLTFAFLFKVDCKEISNSIRVQIRAFSFPIKVLLGISSILILAQSATFPFILDNETYYIQTIKWLNEYGFVPGLANLHLFFGQTSGWHITQSVYSLSFLYDQFNDLNGYLLLIGNFWAFQKLHSYLLNGHKTDLIFGLLPISYIFLFQFVSAPSPDLPVYIIGFVIFSLYLEAHQNPDKGVFSALVILILFAVYIKITAVVLGLLPLFLLMKNFSLLKRQVLSIGFLSVVTLSLFMVKNAIITGYPLYPFGFWALDSQHTIPKGIMDYFFSIEMMHSFYMGFGAYQDASVLDFMKCYLLHSGLDSIIGLGTLLLLFISPLIISKHHPKRGFGSIYFVFVVFILLLVFSSPQYRFYVFFTIFFGLVGLSVIIYKRKWIMAILGLSLFLTAFLVFIPTSFLAVTQNKSLINNSTFHSKNFVVPSPNTKTSGEFTTYKEGNLGYFSINEHDFFWITGNGDLPTVSKAQLNYFKTSFHVIPQRIGTSLGEGFYAKKIRSND